MSEETQQTTFDLTCSDGTTFTLPSNHPEITAGGIGGVSYNAILADPSQIPLHFKQFAIANDKNRPPESAPENGPQDETAKLIGETIKTAKIVCHKTKGCDGENLLILEMESGKTFYIEGGYGGYTGKSCDEYYESIGVSTSFDFA